MVIAYLHRRRFIKGRATAPPGVERLTCLFNVHTISRLEVTFDPNKRAKTRAERDLDFARAVKVFAGRHFTSPDLREAYGEDRFITLGTLDARPVVMVWTPRGEARRIISMRKANAHEQALYAKRLG